MDHRTRTRRASLRRRPSEAPKLTFEELKPEFQWVQDDTHHSLLVHLPGFVRREIKVEAGDKVIKISGSRMDTWSNRFISVDQSYQVPEDAVLEEMTVEFKDGLPLTIVLPILHRQTEKKEATRDHHGDDQNKYRSDDVEAGFPKKPPEEASSSSSSSVEKKKKKKEEEPIQEEEIVPKKLSSDADHNNKLENIEPADEPPTLLDQEEMPKSDDKLHELLEKHKTTGGLESSNGPKTTAGSSRKRKAVWIAGLLLPEEKKSSRRMIAVAVVAFSLGFYVSHVLRAVESNHLHW